MRSTSLAIVTALVLAGCGLSAAPRSSGSASQPSPSRVASPLPASPAAANGGSSFGLLVDPITGNVTLVSTAGRVVATGVATARPGGWRPCGIGGIDFPAVAVSTTRARAYFLDGTTVRWLAPDGATGLAYSIPAGAAMVAGFAISPDDRQVAYTLVDGSVEPLRVSLAVASIPDGKPKLIYAAAAAATLDLVPWPVGWYGEHILLRAMPACSPDGVPATEYRLVDSQTGTGLASIGAAPACTLFEYQELPSAGGIPCNYGNPLIVFAYDGITLHSIPNPDHLTGVAVGTTWASAFGWDGKQLQVIGPDGPHAFPAAGSNVGGWIDSDHVLVGGDRNAEPVVLTISTGGVAPVPAIGRFAGSLPGGLDPAPGI